MKPIPASTILLVRQAGSAIEVVMGLRPNRGAFGGMWVFPGGAVDDDDRARANDDDEAWRLAALREMAEETGIVLATSPVGHWDGDGLYEALDVSGGRLCHEALIYLSNWVTPRPVRKRFDTRFYLAAGSAEHAPQVMSEEFERVGWFEVGQALRSKTSGAMPMIFPTVAHLKYLASFSTVEALEAETRLLDRIPQIEPRLFERGDDFDIEVSNDPRFMP